VTLRLPTLELSSKPSVLESLPFMVEPRIREDPWHIVRSRKKQKQQITTIKSYNSDPSHFSERKLSNSPLETQKKCQKRIKSKYKYIEPDKLEKAATKEKVGPNFKSSSTTRKHKRKSSCDMFKEYLIGIIMWYATKKS